MARSEQLDQLVDDLRQQFRHVVLDLPPVLVGSEGVTAMRLADAHVLVVRHGVTSIKQLRAAHELIGHTESLGVVLNQVRTYTPPPPLSRWLAS